MPCIALNQKKVYRASPARKHDRKIRNTQPATMSEKLHPQTAKLVKTAQPAVEVPVAPIAVANHNIAKRRSASSKSTRKVLDKVKQIKTSALRRSAVKAARKTSVTHPTPSQTSIKSTSSPESPAIRLKDGDKIQIRPHRTCPTTKAAPRPAAVPATAQKPARILKKTAKPAIKPKRRLRFHRPSRADLLNAESRLGSLIFGPIPAGHRREFFHDRENIWIWHESWIDTERHRRQMTVRYEVRPSGVYKKLSAGKYFKLEGAELENFRKATRAYLHLIKQHLYTAA